MDDIDELAAARAAMVEKQLAGRGIRDERVLDAMRRVPRDEFVPAAVREHAYEDRALAIGGGQTISQPYIVALMTEALAVGADDRVLDVGTGSGYQAAIFGELASEVITIERRADLAQEARERLRARGYANVTVVVGDGSLGYQEGAPYDAMLVGAAAPRVPDALLAQLAEGGRLVIPVGPLGHQVLTLVRRSGGAFHEAARDGCVFVPLIGAAGFGDDVA